MMLHCAFEQVPPGGVQIPQLKLQQTSVTLQVLGPHMTLIGAWGALHKTFGQSPPGAVQ
jgi:hypothetical protein